MVNDPSYDGTIICEGRKRARNRYKQSAMLIISDIDDSYIKLFNDNDALILV